MKIVVVSPARNEEVHISDLIKKLRRFKLEIVVVDDGSIDKTEEYAAQHTPYVLSHSINLGKGSSLKTGCDFAFEYLKADAVILMDSDGQHSTKEIPLFCKKLKKGSSMVLGVRNFQIQMPFLRNLLNTFLTQLFYLLYGVWIPDIPSGYKAFTKESYQLIAWEGSGYEVELQIAIKIAQLNIQFECVPIQTIYHKNSNGMNILDVSNAFLKISLSKLDSLKY